VIPLAAPRAGAFDFERGSGHAATDAQHPSGDERKMTAIASRAFPNLNRNTLFARRLFGYRIDTF
jgi:hypothetical protein